ncbi:hypothetical protein AOXY_G27263 [Acipenser oxyrinchus oxyrinchus]|uniref:Fibronectin type-III domain-containing protein n=1 Tax=Acipenser oxyrinchus oxyrinchus TaxID=40147 RepID=A0AAD8CU22_ACIOX|nr:hypothetical protein AOXY_G27263 [Acipenser oxyrinchus oxyrinchus]
MATADSSIELATLGRPFQLGMLYDCRSDSFIPGVTLWNLEELQKDIDVRPKPYTDFQIIASDSLEGKTAALNVEASLAASFFSGLVTVKGSAKYLNDKKTSKRQSRVSLQYLTTTRFEQLTMNHLGYSNVTYPNVFKEGTATHVVTAVLYGAQAFFVFDKQVSSEENEQDIQGSLKVSINKIPFMSIEGEGSLKMTDTDRKSTEGFSCKFYGDFALENNPVSFEEAIKTYATLPQLLGENGENAVPMRVWLYPLNKLDSQAAQLVRQISIGLVRRSQQVLEEFNEHEMQCNDLMNDSVAIQFPEIKSKMRKFKDMCSEYKLVFQKSLARALPSIRGGGEEEGVLVDILSGKEQSPFQNAMLTEWLEDKEREMNVMRSYLSIMKKATVVSSSSELDQTVLDSNNEFVVCFTFTSLKQKETYLKGLKSYLASQASGISEMKTPDACDSKEEPAKWFRSVEISRQTRERVRLFLDFEEANKSKENTKFIVASIEDDLNAGSSVYLYERGVLETSNFELPSKPETPAVCRTTHASVELKFPPLRNGFSEIVKYQVMYQNVKHSEWITLDTEVKTESFTVSGLEPNSPYRFRYQAVCKPGVSLSSDTTEGKTLPTSPPGNLSKNYIDPHSITIVWDKPSFIGEGVSILCYTVEYREDNGESSTDETTKWTEMKTESTKCLYTLEKLKPTHSYRFRVSSVCGEAGRSRPSAEVVIITPMEKEAKSKRVPQEKIQSERFLQFSTSIKEGLPSVHRLSLHEQPLGNSEHYQKFIFGRGVGKEMNKVVMVVGATGAGKTTLINGMINYILGVQWENKFRFKLIHEDTNRTQAESQTSTVTAYELSHQQGFQVPFSLTIIDTPGFGDTRGMDQDKLITQQVKDFFTDPDGVDHIDAVCFVVQASLARLTKPQQYVFDSILSIFGKDIEENILILVTFADCDDIPALGAIKAAKLPCHKDKKGQPTHFAFNNSAIYTQNCVLKKLSDDNDTSDSESDEEDNSLRKKKDVWLDSSKHMKRFFKTLEKVKGKSLLLTKKVLEERQRLETALKQLVPQIQMGLSKLNEIKSMRSSLEQHEASLTANKDFETEIEELRAKRKKTNILSTNCNTCLFSCHSACYLPTPEEMSLCAVMDDAGKCVICPGNCHYSAHSSEMALWEYESVKVKTTIGQLKENFVKASGEFMTTKEILAKLEDEFHKIEDKLMQLIEMSSNCLARLEEIALKPNTLSTVEYIDLLIHNEKEERKPGFEDRIQNLTEMKSQAEIMAKIAKGEKLLPEEKRKYKEKMEKLKKIASQMKQTSSVVKAWQSGH